MEAVEIYYFSVKGNEVVKYIRRILPFLELEFVLVYIILCVGMSKLQYPGNIPV